MVDQSYATSLLGDPTSEAASIPNAHNDHEAFQNQHEEVTHTEKVPIKTGNDNVSSSMLGMQYSDDLLASSRPNSGGGELSQHDKELLHKNAAVPSAEDCAVTVKMIEKPQASPHDDGFKFHQRPPIKQSQTVSRTFNVRSNQEHQSASVHSAENRSAQPVVQPNQQLKVQPSGVSKPTQAKEAFVESSIVPEDSGHCSQPFGADEDSLKTSLKINLPQQHDHLLAGPSPGAHSVVSQKLKSNKKASDKRTPRTAPMSTNMQTFSDHSLDRAASGIAESSMNDEDADIFTLTDKPTVKNITEPNQKPALVTAIVDVEKHRFIEPMHDGQAPTEISDIRVNTNSPEEASSTNQPPDEQIRAPSDTSEHSLVRTSNHETEWPPVEQVLLRDPGSHPEAHPSDASRTRPSPLLSRPMPSEDQLHTNRTGAKSPLHLVTDQFGASKVAKRKPSRPRGTAASRKTAPSSDQLLKPRTPEDFLELTKFIMQQEKLSMAQKAESKLNATVSELQRLREQNDALATQLRETQFEKAELEKASESQRKKVTELQLKGGKLSKFVNGLGNDHRSLVNIRAEFAQEFRELHPIQADIRCNIKTLAEGSKRTAASLGKIRADHYNILQEYGATVKSLTESKAYLEERLSEKVGMLSEERDRHLALDQHLKDFQAQQKSVQDMLKVCTDQIVEKLGSIEGLVAQSKSDEELVELIKRCSADSGVLVQQTQGSAKNVHEMKGLLDGLSSAIQNHFDESKTIESSQSDARAGLEDRVITLLQSMKADISSQEDLAGKNATLRESIATNNEQLKASEGKVNALDSQISDYRVRESSLNDRIKELEASASSLQSDKFTAECTAARLQESVTDKGRLHQELEKAKTEQAEHAVKVASLGEEIDRLQQDKEGLQRQTAEVKRLLEEAKQGIPDFTTERVELEEKARRDLDALEARLNDQSYRLSALHGAQFHRVRKEKEALDALLVTKASEIEALRTEMQLLKEQASESNNYVQKLKHKQAEVQKLEGEKLAVDGKNQELQRELSKSVTHRQGVDSEARKQALVLQQAQDKTKNLQRQLDEAEAAKRATENRSKDIEAGHQERSQANSTEISELRQKLESANNRLEDLNSRVTQQQDLLARKDETLAELKHQQSIQTSAAPKSGSSETLKTLSATQDLQPLVASQSQARKIRKPVNRNIRTSSLQLTGPEMQEDVHGTTAQNVGSESSSKSIFVQFQGRVGPESEIESSQREDDDMLNFDESQFELEKLGSRPATSQSEYRNANSLGSQEILDQDGVRVRSQKNTVETQSQDLTTTRSLISSPLSPVRELSSSYEKAVSETQQSRDLTGNRQSQPSAGVEDEVEDDYSLPSQSETGSPQKIVQSSRNLQGQGRKVTPRRDSQRDVLEQAAPTGTSQSKPGLLPSIKKKGATPSGPQKHLSMLDSSPQNFTGTKSGKGRQTRNSVGGSGSEPLAGLVKQVPLKRAATPSAGSAKKARHQGTNSNSPASGTPARQGKHSVQGNLVATPQSSASTSRRSTREQNMMNRFNNELNNNNNHSKTRRR